MQLQEERNYKQMGLWMGCRRAVDELQMDCEWSLDGMWMGCRRAVDGL
jgi:hypothetical protein